jgi:hypothetical protein
VVCVCLCVLDTGDLPQLTDTLTALADFIAHGVRVAITRVSTPPAAAQLILAEEAEVSGENFTLYLVRA